MYKRFSPILPLLIILCALAACEEGAPWRADAAEEEVVDRDVFGPTAAYDRRLIVLGPGEELPTGAIFDFAALSDSSVVERGIRGRLIDGAEWVPLMDSVWEMDSMREPWRLVPLGPLRLIVGDAGELDALVFDGEQMVRLETGSVIAEYSPDAGTQLVLRQGQLRLGDEPIQGILLDAQLARAITRPRAQASGAAQRSGAGQAPGAAGSDSVPADSAEESIAPTPAPDTADADSTRTGPFPGSRAGTEALLLDNSGYYAVFAASAEGDMAWLHTGGRDDVRPAARLQPTAWEDLPGGARVPSSWRITSPDGVLSGELQAEAADHTALDGVGGTGAMAYVVVSGYVEDRGVRRNVYGLVRHVP